MTCTDINAWLGAYPFRDIGENEPVDLLRAMARVGVDRAWVSHLPAVFWRDPSAGNKTLFAAHDRYPQLVAVPAVHPGLPQWHEVVRQTVARGLPAVRCDPGAYGLPADGPEMRALLACAAAHALVVICAVRFEDIRQRHPHDGTVDLTPAGVRSLIRSTPNARLLITHADREFVEQVHFGATPGEAERILWDFCAIWGPPEDHLALLLTTVGPERFTLGTGTPLRLAEGALARLDLLNPTTELRHALTAGNLSAFLAHAAA